MWERYRRYREVERRIREVIAHPNMSSAFKRQRVADLYNDFWEHTDHPLGPNGCELRSFDGLREASRGDSHRSGFDLSRILRASLERVLRGVINQTIGRALTRAGIDAGDIVAELAPALVNAFDLSGRIDLEASWAQLWVYPAERERESLRIVGAKTRPALRVARALSNAPNPAAYGLGRNLERIDAVLRPILQLISRLLNNPEKLLRDALRGQLDLGQLRLRNLGDLTTQAEAFVNGLSELIDSNGVNCRNTSRRDGNYLELERRCKREIYFEAMAGPRERLSGHLWQDSHEVFPVSLINVMVLPETSKVFLRHHALFFDGKAKVRFRVDFKDVLKAALEDAAKRMLRKALEKIRDRLTPDELRRFMDWLDVLVPGQ